MTLDDGSRVELASLFQGCGLSPDFFALRVRGLLRSIRTELVCLPSAQDVAPALSAYLDDFIGIVPREAVFDSLDKLRELGPKAGLHFDNILKNYFYLPVRFKDKFFKFLAETGADRVIKVVTNEDAGAITVEAEALEAEERERATATDGAMAGADLEQRSETVGQVASFSEPGCLVSFVGVERVLGAPFRVIDDVTRSGDADFERLRAQVSEQSQKAIPIRAAKCFPGYRDPQGEASPAGAYVFG